MMRPVVHLPSEEVVQTFRDLIAAAERGTHVPANVLVAALVLGVGWLLAFVARGIVGRLVRNTARLMGPRGDERMSVTMVSLHRVDTIAGRIAFWVVVLFTLMWATQELGLPVVSKWLIGVAV